MEGEKPQHGQHQLEEEAVRDAAADGATESVQAHPMQEDVAVLMEDAAGRPDLDLDAIALDDEAMAHALHMEELMQVEDWDLRRFEFEEPAVPRRRSWTGGFPRRSGGAGHQSSVCRRIANLQRHRLRPD